MWWAMLPVSFTVTFIVLGQPYGCPYGCSSTIEVYMATNGNVMYIPGGFISTDDIAATIKAQQSRVII